MKKFIESKIIGNKDEAIEQAINELKFAFRHCNGLAQDAIVCALSRLGVEIEADEQEQERKRNEYIKMNF